MRMNIGNPEVDTKTNILDIEIPSQMEKSIPTGIKHFDVLCAGDGVIPSTVLLLTGVPGSGKTTLSAQLADGITGKGNVCLYNTCEESLVQLSKTAKRLNLKNGFIPSSINELGALLERADLVMSEAAWNDLQKGEKVNIVTTEDFKKKYVYKKKLLNK